MSNRGPMSKIRGNPTVLLVIGLPLFAIFASVGTAVIAVTRGDPVLPDEYHWEGQTLDRDFALSRRAVELKVRAVLRLQPVAGECRASLRLNGPLPPAIELRLTHVSLPALDRRIRFTQSGDTSTYVAPCSLSPSGQWHVELSDVAHSWSFREEAAGSLETVDISTGSTRDSGAWP